VTADVLVGLLAERARMAVFAAVVLGAASPAEVATRTGLSIRTVSSALRRLTDGGLVTSTDGRLAVRVDALKQAARRSPRARAEGDEPLDADRARAAVLRSFIVDGRLVSIPAAAGKRRVVLEHIVAAFEPGIRYPEREVNAVLRAWHPDFAALRRYLIDEDLMARDRSVYWRIGGPVDLRSP
jgi:hypothetical protein